PLADRRRGAARLPRGDRTRGWRGDGHPPPRAACRGRPVPSRVGADGSGDGPARELPGRRGGVSEQPNELVTEALDAVAGGRDLSPAEASAVLAEIMRGAVSPTQVAGFLIALRTKGETVDELAGLAQTMRELATRVEVSARDLL